MSCIGEARDRTPSAIAARPSLLDREATVSATLDQQPRLCFGTRITRAPFFDSDTLLTLVQTSDIDIPSHPKWST